MPSAACGSMDFTRPSIKPARPIRPCCSRPFSKRIWSTFSAKGAGAFHVHARDSQWQSSLGSAAPTHRWSRCLPQPCADSPTPSPLIITIPSPSFPSSPPRPSPIHHFLAFVPFSPLLLAGRFYFTLLQELCMSYGVDCYGIVDLAPQIDGPRKGISGTSVYMAVRLVSVRARVQACNMQTYAVCT